MFLSCSLAYWSESARLRLRIWLSLAGACPESSMVSMAWPTGPGRAEHHHVPVVASHCLYAEEVEVEVEVGAGLEPKRPRGGTGRREREGAVGGGRRGARGVSESDGGARREAIGTGRGRRGGGRRGGGGGGG